MTLLIEVLPYHLARDARAAGSSSPKCRRQVRPERAARVSGPMGVWTTASSIIAAIIACPRGQVTHLTRVGRRVALNSAGAYDRSAETTRPPGETPVTTVLAVK